MTRAEQPRPAPVVLIVLDGWGIRPAREHNAIALARTPVYDEVLARYPNAQLIASGEAVGLPEGQMGNSEVGHTNMGAGRVVYQDLTRIDKSIRDGELAGNAVLSAAMDRCTDGKHALHFVGLVSDGGVHSHHRHLHAMVEMAAARRLSRVYRSRHHRWPRYLADRWRALRRRARSRDGATPNGSNRHRRRSLLRDGPRQAVGADEARVGRDGPRLGSGDCHRRGGTQCEPRTPPASPTSSSHPVVLTDAEGKPIAPIRGRGLGCLLQFPRRPHAADHPRASRSTTSTASIGRTARTSRRRR